MVEQPCWSKNPAAEDDDDDDYDNDEEHCDI